jgi:hypothetical protein
MVPSLATVSHRGAGQPLGPGPGRRGPGALGEGSLRCLCRALQQSPRAPGPARQVTSWLDESTLGLLFGMMILVGQLKNTGLFEVLCAATLRACRGRMWLLSIMLMYLTGGGWGWGRGRVRGWGYRPGRGNRGPASGRSWGRLAAAPQRPPPAHALTPAAPSRTALPPPPTPTHPPPPPSRGVCVPRQRHHDAADGAHHDLADEDLQARPARAAHGAGALLKHRRHRDHGERQARGGRPAGRGPPGAGPVCRAAPPPPCVACLPNPIAPSLPACFPPRSATPPTSSVSSPSPQARGPSQGRARPAPAGTARCCCRAVEQRPLTPALPILPPFPPPPAPVGTSLSKYLGFVDFIINLGPGAGAGPLNAAARLRNVPRLAPCTLPCASSPLRPLIPIPPPLTPLNTPAGVILASLPALGLVLLMFRRDLLGPVPNYEECLRLTSECAGGRMAGGLWRTGLDPAACRRPRGACSHLRLDPPPLPPPIHPPTLPAPTPTPHPPGTTFSIGTSWPRQATSCWRCSWASCW